MVMPKGQHYLGRLSDRAYRCGKPRNRGTRWSLDISRVNCVACCEKQSGDAMLDAVVRHAVDASKRMAVPARDVPNILLRAAMLWERAANERSP